MCLPFGQIPYIYGPGNFHTITQGSSLTVFYYTSSLSVDLLKSFSFRYTIVCIIFSTFTLASAIQTDSCLYDIRTLHVINMDVWSISVESWICRSGYLPELLVSSREPILQRYIYPPLHQQIAPDIEVPNDSVDKNSQETSACYPRRTFCLLIDNLSIRNYRVIMANL